jgi:hypothetical protein
MRLSSLCLSAARVTLAVAVTLLFSSAAFGRRRRQLWRLLEFRRRWGRWFARRFHGRVQFFREFRGRSQLGRAVFKWIKFAQFRRIGLARIEWA